MTAFTNKVTYVCDSCKETIVSTNDNLFLDNFKKANEEIKQKGWQIKWQLAGPYLHYCPKCIQPTIKVSQKDRDLW